ncbi:MAG TPA: type II toxin-antitoxin system VapC family toxin [Pirellulales bacterium]|nr:type II toxin-antitoxin system VapC family toxin [Pirellulales bacterium]
MTSFAYKRRHPGRALYLGIRRAPAKRLNNIAGLLTDLKVSNLDERCAGEFGRISADLRRKGITVGGLDRLIAATAKVYGHVLVTHNARDFKSIPGLTLVDWLGP